MPTATSNPRASWLLAAALLVTLLAGYFAYSQSPRPDPFAAEPGLFSLDWWLYPHERNAFRRLPAVGVTLNDVFALPDGEHLWAVGDAGLILHSSDGGRNWRQQALSSTPDAAQAPAVSASVDLQSVFFVDGQRGWIVGASGKVFVTKDGGASWGLQSQSANAPLARVQFPADGRSGWLVGGNGTILHTQDGGNLWRAQSSNTQNYLSDLYFLPDARRGWAVGWSGTILATSDGGASWQAQASGSKKGLVGVQFLDDGLRGWAVGLGGTLLTTQDGGAHWQTQTFPFTADLASVQFLADGLTGWVANVDGEIWVTHDGGARWRNQTGVGKTALERVRFLADGLRGWAVGASGTMLATADGGAHWLPQSRGKPKTWFGVHFLADAQSGWAVGERGLLLHSTDGGHTWQTQASGTTEQLLSIQFLDDARNGWTVGESGTILATNDGGKTWLPQAGGMTKTGLSGLRFLADGRRGWVVGDDGTLLATRDGGNTWQFQASGTKADLYTVQFLADGVRGWAVGAGGTLLATVDGGATWQPRTSGTSADLYAAHFAADGRAGWVAGQGGTVLATVDGGATWQAQASATRADLYAVQFMADERTGWAVGKNGTLLTTQDGGQVWRAQAGLVQTTLYRVQFLADARHGWAVGQDETLLATTDGGLNWQDPVLPSARYFPPWYYLSWLPTLVLLWRVRATSPPHASQPQQSDRPLEPGDVDYLNFAPLARALSSLLRNQDTEPPLTLAITGEWGSGKSSIMNLLKHDLQSNGFHPVWFNAWHHKDEQNVLESMLEAVREQTLLRWWWLRRWWFRWRLLFKRHWLIWFSALALLVVLIIAPGYWLYRNPQHRAVLWPYVGYTVGWRQPAVLTPRSLDRLCLGAVEAKATPPKTADGPPFSAEDCRRLRANLSWKADVATSGACTYDNACLFGDEGQLLRTIQENALLDHPLTEEQSAALLKQTEHIKPAHPFEPYTAVLDVLGIVVAALLLVLFKGAAVFGVNAGELLRPLLQRLGMIETGESIGFRQFYQHRFRHFVEVLGQRCLVIFIDDLDRCDQAHTMRVLETTNFLVSSGACFFVIGMAPRYVLSSVGLHFKELAQEVSEETEKPGATPSSSDGRGERIAFARHYLQKLVNIEAPVPKPNAAQSRQLLLGDQQALEQHKKAASLERGLIEIAGWLRLGLLLGLVSSAVYLFSQVSLESPLPQKISAVPAAATPRASDTPASDVVSSPSALNGGAEPGKVFVPGADEPAGWEWLPILCIGILAGLVVLYRRRDLLQRWPTAVKLLDWLRIALVAPETVEDSPKFCAALALWHGLIAAKDPSPRSIKAFKNRLRYFVARAADDDKGLQEAHLVALAAIQYAVPDWLGRATAARPDELKNANPLLLFTLDEHERQFGKPDDLKHKQYFERISAGMEIHGSAN